MKNRRWSLLAVVMALALAMAVAACGDDDDDDGGGGGGGGGDGGGGGTIALLLPESKTARYESQDRPNFERKVQELCPDCEIIYSNADQDAAQQQQQTEAAITQGAEVLVLDPVDGAAAGPLVTRAKSQDIPVISYDRLILDADVDYYISFDNEKVGQLQGESLVSKLEEDGAQGDIVMINGAPTDNNAKLFKNGAHSVIDDSPFKVAREFDTPDWSPDEAQQEMEQAITALGKDGFVGVYAANDGTAGGAIAAMKGNGRRSEADPGDGAGRRAGRDPADPGRRAVHDRLQGDQAGGRGGGRAGRGARARRGAARGHGQRRDRQRHEGRAVGPARARGGDEGQHQRHDRQGRVLAGERDLLGPVRVSLQGSGHSVGNSGVGPGGARRAAGHSRIQERSLRKMDAKTPVLELEGVSKSFGPVQALSDVTFRVHEGEVVALVGDNGAGKSTLVKTIAGIHDADEGRILFEGNEVNITHPTDAVHLGIATVYQDLALCDNLDVVENLFLGREEGTFALDETSMEKQTGQLLGRLAVTIIDMRSEVGTLSGGQRQQVAIARSLLGDPRVVILDEPTAALGVRQTAMVLDLIKRLREEGHAVVVISHNLADVFEVADRIFVLRLGREAGDIAAGETSQEEVVAAITGATGGREGER